MKESKTVSKISSEKDVKLLDVESVRNSIVGWPSDYVRQLFDFGVLLNQGESQRSATVDSKLGVLLAFNAAITAIILSMWGNVAAWHATEILIFAIVSFFVSTTSATCGLWVRACNTPSETDWFLLDRGKDRDRLLEAHVVYLLDWHRNQLQFNNRKVSAATITQLTFALGSFATSVAAIVNFFRL